MSANGVGLSAARVPLRNPVEGELAARSRYEDIVLHLLGPLARPIMEKLMRSHYEFRSELARERFAEGLSQGLEQGIEKGKRAMAADLARLRYGEAAAPLLPLIASADQATLGSLAEGILQGKPVEEIRQAWTAGLHAVAAT